MKSKNQKIRLCIFTIIFIFILSFTPCLKAELTADFDDNCLVNIEDLSLLAQYWLNCPTPDCPADADNDNDTDINDFAALADTFSLSSIITATASS